MGSCGHLKGGDDGVSAPQAPGLLLGPQRPVHSALLAFPGGPLQGLGKPGLLEPVWKTTSPSENTRKNRAPPLLAFYISGSMQSLDWEVKTERILLLLRLWRSS